MKRVTQTAKWDAYIKETTAVPAFLGGGRSSAATCGEETISSARS
jgi:hypothetical protein